MLPNLITALRLAVLVPLFMCLTDGSVAGRWAALALFLFAGASDVLDGWLARRMNLTSAFGSFLDLIADRLLTLVSVAGLVAAGILSGVWAVAGLALVARDFLVAGLNERFGDLGIRTGAGETAKVTLQFIGLALLAAPPIFSGQASAGRWSLAASALAAAWLGLVYIRRALRTVSAA